jgi:short-subunit dehydrogenase
LITGASAGIGKSYARQLAGRGYDLVLVARDTARLEALAIELGAGGADAEVLAADLTRSDDVAGVERRLESDACISFFLNNAGIATVHPVLETPLAVIENLISLNVTAATRLALAAGRAFVARGRGTIVNMASAVSVNPERFNGVYGGTKSFLMALTLAMNKDMAGKGVRSQVVLPGATLTEIWERAGKDPATLNPAVVMETDELVAAALAGLDQGELVTIPSLEDAQILADYEAARAKLFPHLSRNHAAARYKS